MLTAQPRLAFFNSLIGTISVELKAGADIWEPASLA
jgi:hypothetical protein